MQRNDNNIIIIIIMFVSKKKKIIIYMYIICTCRYSVLIKTWGNYHTRTCVHAYQYAVSYELILLNWVATCTCTVYIEIT